MVPINSTSFTARYFNEISFCSSAILHAFEVIDDLSPQNVSVQPLLSPNSLPDHTSVVPSDMALPSSSQTPDVSLTVNHLHYPQQRKNPLNHSTFQSCHQIQEEKKNSR